MKKTISIDIAGQLFRIDEDAFDLLSNYLKRIKENFSIEQGGEETVSDIENRIAEIFGGGQEPPVVITKEMITEMINIMGSPEDYNDHEPAKDGHKKTLRRREIYNPNSISSQIGRALSEFRKATGKVLYSVFRVFMIVAGSALSLLGFVLLFSFIMTLFFNGTPLVRDLFEPEITNLNTLLSIVLNTQNIFPVIVLSAIVIIIPLAVLVYLGIIMVFNIKGSSKWISIIMFIVWGVSVAILGVILSAKLSVYSNHESMEEKTTISNPPDTIYISSLNRIDISNLEELSSVENFSFFRDNNSKNLCGTVELNIYASDSTGSYLMVDKKAHGKTHNEAWSNAKSIQHNYRFAKNTLYLDEYFTISGGKNWNGSTVEAYLAVPKGTIIKIMPGTNGRILRFNRSFDELQLIRVEEYGYEYLDE